MFQEVRACAARELSSPVHAVDLVTTDDQQSSRNFDSSIPRNYAEKAGTFASQANCILFPVYVWDCDGLSPHAVARHSSLQGHGRTIGLAEEGQ